MNEVIAEKLVTVREANSTILITLQEDASGLFLGYLGDAVRDAKEDPYGSFARSHTIHLFDKELTENKLVKVFAREIFWDAMRTLTATPFTRKDSSLNSKLWAQYLAAVHRIIESKNGQLPPTLREQKTLKIA